jgi:hypothetical protein
MYPERSTVLVPPASVICKLFPDRAKPVFNSFVVSASASSIRD